MEKPHVVLELEQYDSFKRIEKELDEKYKGVKFLTDKNTRLEAIVVNLLFSTNGIDPQTLLRNFGFEISRGLNQNELIDLTINK